MKLSKLTTTALLSCIGCAPAPSALAAISINDVTVTEGQTAVLTISLTEAVERGNVRVDYTTQNGSATAGQDYVAESGTLQFRRGDQTLQISIQTVNNNVYEPTETFNVVLSNARGDNIGDGTAVVTIPDNDTQANRNPVCSIDTPAGDVSITVGDVVNYTGTVTDPDGDPVSISWSLPGGNSSSSSVEDPGNVTYANPGTFVTTLNASDGNGGNCAQESRTITVTTDQPPPPQAECAPADLNLSINSTSQNGCPDSTLLQADKVLNSSFKVLAINDLGMHCGDLDTRIASILPPFQVLLAQVIQQGAQPVLNPAGVSVVYAAASNPNDPILGGNVFDGMMSNGDTFKTNFWDFPLVAGTYDAFYPAYNPFDPGPTATNAVTPLAVNPDVGIPVPNLEDFYIGPDGVVNNGNEFFSAVVHAMPGVAAPYTANAPQQVQEHYQDKPFFINFPFGYVAADVNWYEGAGIPFSAFDDNGRENAYPLVRVEARSGNSTLATVDTVLPISGEASCVNCHADPTDINNLNSRSSAPTNALDNAGLPVVQSGDDPNPNLPPRVSLEYASDINTLRLHDLKHGANYVAPSPADDGTTVAAPCDITANGGDGDANCLTHKALVQGVPVVCQVCHYTPALDIANLGPLTGPAGGIANGRNQTSHSSNSNVMHSHHAGTGLFPAIPAPVQAANGVVTNQTERLQALEESCYQCHPGTNVQCLRGAMFNGDMLCSDCHGTMEQVGNDFSADVSPGNAGAFALNPDGNFYDLADPQPRVPWANEPGCGSCHTGDVNDNLAGDTGTVVNTADTLGNTDGIRLRVAYLTDPTDPTFNPKAAPIVPSNKRFAEPEVPASFNGFANPGAGNPQLYRVSTGHGGVMCEGCHGATHAEWPNANPNSNDNITADQLQGHTGEIIECDTCHGTAMNGQNTLAGPHGMHPVGNDTSVSSGSAAGPRVSFVDGGHENLAEGDVARCTVCHGTPADGSSPTRRNIPGSVLAVAKKDRRLNGQTIPAGTPIACAICHGGGGD